MNEVGVRLLVLAACLLGGAFFAGMETGIVSINRLRLRHLVQRRVRAAVILDEFVRQPDYFLGTTLVGTNLSYVVASVMTAALGARLHPVWGPVGGGLALSMVVLVFCEYLPKAWFQSAPARRTMPLAWLLRGFGRLFLPVGWVVTRIARAMLPGGPADEGQPMVSREELIHLTDEGRRAGSLTPVESRMIRNVFEIGGRRVGEIMVPRDRMLQVEAGRPAGVVLEMARTREVKRLPVWDPDRGAFTGIVNIFDILLDPDGAKRPVSEFARPPQLVPVRESVEHIMPRMRVSRQPMMLVVDDRFDVVGLVTIEDVLREVVGNE